MADKNLILPQSLPQSDLLVRLPDASDQQKQAIIIFFNCTDGVAHLPWQLWCIWFPCSPAMISSTKWLEACSIYHIATASRTTAHRQTHVLPSDEEANKLWPLVHALYYEISDGPAHDLVSVFDILNVCHTMVVVYPTLHIDGTTIVNAAAAAI